MVEFKWLNKNNTGIEEIDNQHKTIIVILNELYEAMRSKENNKNSSELIAKLAKYAEEHFATEEKLLEKYEFSGYERHKQLHNIYREKLKSFERNYTSKKGALVVDMASFLSEWLIDHICNADQEYSEFLKNKMK